MTMFDIVVPVVALGIAVTGALILKLSDPMRNNRAAEPADRASLREAPVVEEARGWGHDVAESVRSERAGPGYLPVDRAGEEATRTRDEPR